MPFIRVWVFLGFALSLGAFEAPRLEIHPAGIQNLGSLGPREKRTIVYTIRNASKAPIALKVANQPEAFQVKGLALQQALQPGEALPLSLEVDATGQSAWIKRKVELVTDDPQQGRYLLPVEASVRPDLTVDRLRATILPARRHESPEAVFQLVRETGDPLALQLKEPLPSYLDPRIESRDGKAEFHVVFRPSRVEPGVGQGLEVIHLETNVPGQSEQTLYLNWSIQTPLLAKPSRLVFERVNTQELELTHPKGQVFKMDSVMIDGPGFVCEAYSAESASTVHLQIRRTLSCACQAQLVIGLAGEMEAFRVPLVGLPEVQPK